MAYRKIKKNGEAAKPTLGKGKQPKVSLDVFTKVTNEYLEYCEKNKQIPLIKKLAVLLGIDTDTLVNYRKKPHYSAILKRIDDLTEIALLEKGINENKPVFPMFLLKSKFGYVEQQYVKADVSLSGSLGFSPLPSKKR